MMRLLFIILLFPLLSSAQTHWGNIPLDDRITVLIPVPYEETDTLGQIYFRGVSDLGVVVVNKIPQPPTKIVNDKVLMKYYASFQEMIIQQNHATLVSDSAVMLKGLYALSFVLEFRGDYTELQEHMVLFIDNNLYSFSYLYSKEKKAEVQEERDRFFSGIEIRNTSIDDQVASTYSPQMEVVGYVVRYIILVVLAFAAVLWFMKKYRYVLWIKNILSMILLMWGCVCLFIFVIGLLFGKHNEFLLIPGIVCLIIGYGLKILKVPDTGDAK